MSLTRKIVRWSILFVILILLVALALFLLLRKPDTSPVPEFDEVASPIPPQLEATPVPTSAHVPTDEVEAQVVTTAEPAAAPAICFEGVCTISLELPSPLGIPIHFVDDSPTFDWTVPSQTCLSALGTFVGRQKMVWSEITVTLQDELSEAGTPVEFQFPPSEDPLNDPAPDAAVGQCVVDSGERSQVACHVQVQRNSELPNHNMDIAIIAASLDALRRVHHEEFVGDLEPFYHFSEMELFDPAVQSQGGDWRSQCLQVLQSALDTTP